MEPEQFMEELPNQSQAANGNPSACSVLDEVEFQAKEIRQVQAHALHGSGLAVAKARCVSIVNHTVEYSPLVY